MNTFLTFLRRAIFLCACLALHFSATAAIIYVNPSAGGANNGTSWANAFTNLTSALQAASPGDEVWVVQGVYKPITIVDLNASGGLDAREATFVIPSGVALYGGFIGTEGNRDERNWSSNVTILSGDIDNNDVNLDGNFVAEASADVVGNNAYHVIYTFDVSPTTRLDGFVVTAGRAATGGAPTDANQDGGGLYNRLSPGGTSSPTIVNMTFQGNYASDEGGAIYNTNPGLPGGTITTVIENSKFLNNASNYGGGAIYLGSFKPADLQLQIRNSEFIGNTAYRRGGAIQFIGDHAIVENTKFVGNTVTVVWIGETRPGAGGAVAMTASNATFRDCIFQNNSSTGTANGPFEGGGGGAVSMSSNEPQTRDLGISAPTFIGCGFYDNTAAGNNAAWGGAANHLSDGGNLQPKYVNCVFSGNEAENEGGAISNFTRVTSLEDESAVVQLTPSFTNCTFTGNHAGTRGGGLYFHGYEYMGTQLLRARVENSILWDNSATVSGPEIHRQNSATNVVAYSLIEGSGGSGGGWNSAMGTDAGNNIDENPDFVNAADPEGADNIPANSDDGLRVGMSSPAINAGNNAAAGLAGITIDYALGTRIQNLTVDLGAYERTGIFIPDLDFAWIYEWRPIDPGCLSCPWSFLLLDRIFQNFIWEGPAQLADDGKTATIKGKIVNIKDKKIGFEVYLKLENKQNWKSWNAKGRTYAAFTLEALAAAKQTHTRWSFWELSSESYLKGFGNADGVLKLSHAPSNYKLGFQMGTGANGWDKDLGIGGTFFYRGTLKIKGKKYSLKGAGSMNVDAVPCKKDCTPIDENSRIATLDDIEIEEVKNEISVYPIPARDYLTISNETVPAGKYAVKFYDRTGVLKKNESMDTDHGNFGLSLNGIEPGLYILKLISASGETLTRKVLVE